MHTSLYKVLTDRKGLSHGEARVAEFVARGLSNAEIAEKMIASERAIKECLNGIYLRMGLKSRAQLIVWCLPHIGAQESV